MRVISKTAAESMPGDTPTWASKCWAVKSAATVHATEGMATTHVATESAMTCEASVAATTGATVATVLREGRRQRQHKDERRNGYRATHTSIICPVGNLQAKLSAYFFSLLLLWPQPFWGALSSEGVLPRTW
jgi:hypothetical protein